MHKLVNQSNMFIYLFSCIAYFPVARVSSCITIGEFHSCDNRACTRLDGLISDGVNFHTNNLPKLQLQYLLHFYPHNLKIMVNPFT